MGLSDQYRHTDRLRERGVRKRLDPAQCLLGEYSDSGRNE